MSQSFIAIVKSTKSMQTKYGQKTLIKCSGNLKTEFTIWINGVDDEALALNPGDRITCACHENGKEFWLNNTPVVKPGEFVDYLPVATGGAIALVEPEIEEIAEVPDNSGGAFDRHIESLTARIADCYRATKAQLPELSEETIQKLATSVFIQLCKDTY